jgi:hypothetical protein
MALNGATADIWTLVEWKAMVMIARGWKWIVALCTMSAMLASMREVWATILHTDAAMEPIAQPPVADTAEKDLASAIYANQSAEQAPPPAPSMPIGHRWVHAEPQNYPRYVPQDDSWWTGMPRVLRESVT